MSSSATTNADAPQSSALPPSVTTPIAIHSRDESTSNAEASGKVVPHRKPILRLELRDLSSPGARAFLRLVHASIVLEDAVDVVLQLLYTGLESQCIPSTRSVTLILRSFSGVAFTKGTDLDDDHKEIHLSTDYINHVPESRKNEEIRGVIVHEMVHCWQQNARGSAPGGLIEGIADWVRLKAGFAPPHWKRTADCKWDAGYERTGFFLEWLESEHGVDIVRRINKGLKDCKYDSDAFWNECCGKSIDHLWRQYKRSLGVDDSDVS